MEFSRGLCSGCILGPTDSVGDEEAIAMAVTQGSERRQEKSWFTQKNTSPMAIEQMQVLVCIALFLWPL